MPFRSVLLPIALRLSSLALAGSQLPPADTLPPVNRAVLRFVDAHMGKRVGRGECWDLAAEALDRAGAMWDHDLRFGRELDPRRDVVLPGDVIQFEGVQVDYRRGTSQVRERYGHHTAIIHAVKEPGSYVLAHQNIGRAGRRVQLTGLRLTDITKGEFHLFRPQP